MSEHHKELLRAASRGARIQVLVWRWGMSGMLRQWVGTHAMPLPGAKDDATLYRIHPNDAHLRYGPVAELMREQAKNPPPMLPVLAAGSTRFKLDFWLTDVLDYASLTNDLARGVFLELLAERLADDGF